MAYLYNPDFPKDAPIERVTGGFGVCDTNHAQVHAGNAFSCVYNDTTGLAQGAIAYLTFTIPDGVYCHWQAFEVTTDGGNDLLFSFYDETILNATPAGTLITPSNRSRQGLGKRSVNVLTLAAAVTDTNTVTINGRTYTFQTVLVDAADNVLIGANAAASVTNLVNAITLAGGTPGTHYGTATTVNTDVTAYDGPGDTVGIVSKSCGVNALACTETLTHADSVWASATMTGGAAATTGRASRTTVRLAPTIDYIGYESFDAIQTLKQGAVNSRTVGSKSEVIEWVMKAGRTFAVKVHNNGSGAGTVRWSMRPHWYEEGGY